MKHNTTICSYSNLETCRVVKCSLNTANSNSLINAIFTLKYIFESQFKGFLQNNVLLRNITLEAWMKFEPTGHGGERNMYNLNIKK